MGLMLMALFPLHKILNSSNRATVMNRATIAFFSIRFLQGILLAVICVHAICANADEANVKENKVSLNITLLKYENDLIEVKANKIALGKVLQELALKTKLQINLYDPGISSQLISVSIKKQSLTEAVKIILEDFSYALYPAEEDFAVVVLSPPLTSTKSTRKVSPSPEPSAIFGIASNSAQNIAEFPSIVAEDLSPVIDDDEEVDSDSNSKSAIEQEYIEALLDRVNEAKSSPEGQIDQETMDELVNIDDPRATEILIDTATTGMDTISPTDTVGPLWRHAENLKFFDTDSVKALKQLAQDNDDS